MENQEQSSFMSVELTGNELESKTKYYKSITEQLFHHIKTLIEQTTNPIKNEMFPEIAAGSYKNIIDRYIVCLQKYSKWNEFYTFFCISNPVSVVGKQTSLYDAIITRDGFNNLLAEWEKGSYQIADKSFLARLQSEPTLDGILSQQQSLSAIILSYDKAINEAKNKTITISVTKQFFEL